MTHACGFQLALIAFATAALHAFWAAAALDTGLQTALAAGAAFYVAGAGFGEILRRLIEELVDAELASANPATTAQPAAKAS